MKCKDCEYREEVFYDDDLELSCDVCTAAEEPFIIDNLNFECTEFPEKAIDEVVKTPDLDFSNVPKFYVDDDAIWTPVIGTSTYQQIMSKEMFVEAYNRWIKGIEPTEDIYRLNPCFVCGSTIVVKPYGDALVVQCTGCGTRLEYKGTMNSLAAFWNNITEEK